MSNDYSFGSDIHAYTHNHNVNVKHIKSSLLSIYRLHQVLLIYKYMYHLQDELPTFIYTDPLDCPFSNIDFEKLKELHESETLHRVQKECERSNDYYCLLWNYHQDLAKRIHDLENSYHWQHLSNWRELNNFISANISYITNPAYQTIITTDD